MEISYEIYVLVQECTLEPGIVANVYSPCIWEMDSGELRVLRQPGLCREILSLEKEKKRQWRKDNPSFQQWD
jgi:hypothetical protein